jgi:hypothetical protein
MAAVQWSRALILFFRDFVTAAVLTLSLWHTGVMPCRSVEKLFFDLCRHARCEEKRKLIRDFCRDHKVYCKFSEAEFSTSRASEAEIMK